MNKMDTTSSGDGVVDKMSDNVDANIVREGKADVMFPSSVFYNPVQEFNRDLTICVISEFALNFIETKARKKGVKNATVERHIDESIDCPELSPENNTPVAHDSIPITSPENNTPVVHDSIPITDENKIILKPGDPCEHGLKILEGLSASGLRSVRFAKEIPGIKEIITNDFDKTAVTFIEKNIERNQVENLMRSNCGDASMVMYQNRRICDRFDVIDLDPYGTASPFLDAAVQSVQDGGLLCVTCTDAAVLCGNTGEACFAKYGAMSLRTKCCHEMAIRILLQCIDSHANRYSRYIIPLISLSIDFYMRVFVQIRTGQAKVKESVCKRSLVFNCVGCGSFFLQGLVTKTKSKGDNLKFSPPAYSVPTVGTKCPHCNHKMQIGGPIWDAPIHDVDFVKRVVNYAKDNKADFETSNRIIGVLSVVTEELQDAPLYYEKDGLCNVLHCQAPTFLEFSSAILNAGYHVSLSHAAKNSIKTDAPTEVIWDILRTWVKDHPVNENRLQPGSVAKVILDKAPSPGISFEEHPEANPQSRQDRLLRYQHNPEKDWGPKARAKNMDVELAPPIKRTANQGKRTELKERDPNYLKQFPCKKFQRGECDRADDCLYNHKIGGTTDDSNMEQDD